MIFYSLSLLQQPSIHRSVKVNSEENCQISKEILSKLLNPAPPKPTPYPRSLQVKAVKNQGSASLCLFLSSRSPVVGHRLGQHRKRQILRFPHNRSHFSSMKGRNCASCSTSSQNLVFSALSSDQSITLPWRIQNIVQGEI